MTSATSSQPDPRDDESLSEVTIGTCKRLLEFAYKHYNEAMKTGERGVAAYWDGYIRGVQHVLEARHE